MIVDFLTKFDFWSTMLGLGLGGQNSHLPKIALIGPRINKEVYMNIFTLIFKLGLCIV